MKQNMNSFPLRFNKSNNRTPKVFKNYTETNNTNRKIMSVERNLNDLNLDTETEISNKGSDIPFFLDGLKKEMDEISQNILENDKKVWDYTRKNIENSKRLRQKSQQSLHLPKYNFGEYNYGQSESNYFSPDRYKYQTPSKANNMANYNAYIARNNNMYNNNNYINDNNNYINNFTDYNYNNNNYNTSFNFYKKNINNADYINVNNYYKKNMNNTNIKKGYIKQSNSKKNSIKISNNNSFNFNKVAEI